MIGSQLCARQGCEADSLLPTTRTKAVCKQLWPQTPPHALGATRPAKAREPICSLHALSAPGSRLQLLLAAPACCSYAPVLGLEEGQSTPIRFTGEVGDLMSPCAT